MEKWTFRNYEEPYLAADSIRVDPESGELLVRAADAGPEYVIEHEGGAADKIAARLEALVIPGHASWRQFDRADPDSEWFGLIEQMDYLGLVRDAKWRRDVDLQRAELDGFATRAADEIVGAAGDEAGVRQALESNVRRVRDFVGALVRSLAVDVLPDRAPSAPTVSPRAAFACDGFFLQTLMLQAAYWRRSAPLSLVMGLVALERAAERLGLPSTDLHADTEALIDELAGGLYEVRDVRAHLGCVGNFVARSVGADAARRSKNVFEPAGRMTGLQFMSEIERQTDEAMYDIGTPKFVEAIERPDASIDLARGCYLEEYRPRSP